MSAICLQGAFIQTIEALSTLGYIVMVSNQGRYFRLASYLASFTQKSIVIAMGIPALKVGPLESLYIPYGCWSLCWNAFWHRKAQLLACDVFATVYTQSQRRQQCMQRSFWKFSQILRMS